MRITLDQALDLIWSGDLVAFPTETVYGLAASALDPTAVAKVFRAKGRPSDNPLIVHVASIDMARSLVAADWPDTAQTLADRFWPGPLTLVLPKGPMIPQVVTAGGDTVAVRMPDHPLALELIDRAGAPLVGPSANPSGRVSPTTADHVEHDHAGTLPVLDGGACARGIESTVLDLTAQPPTVLRSGVVIAEDLRAALGGAVASRTQAPHSPDRPARSPGTLAAHYAPMHAALRLHEHADPLRINPPEVERNVYVTDRSDLPLDPDRVVTVPGDPVELARVWYAALREADRLAARTGAAHIEVVLSPGAITPALRDRIDRAVRT